MAQILDPVPPDNQNQILCCYVNATSHIQIARISNIANWYFERVVFPGQRLVFEALPDALLEIHTGMMASAILSDTIPCSRLCVDDNGNSTAPANTEQDIKTTDNKPVRETINAVSSMRRLPEESLTLAAVL